MADATGIRAGKAYVEMGGKDVNLKKMLIGAQKDLRRFGMAVSKVGRGLGEIGKRFLAVGAGGLAGLSANIKIFATLESAMAELRANAQPTAHELLEINDAIKKISKQTGAGPAKVAQTFGELLKAGLPLRSVIDGAAASTLQFAKVAGMEGAQAAIILADAMNVFGVSAEQAGDIISKAADASSISVEDVAQSFSQVSAVAHLAGMTIEETAASIALLGSAGVKGSDAGTSLKTMLVRLMTGAEGAGQMMWALGIRVRKANGDMKPMRGIIQELQNKMAGLNKVARDEVMFKLFGSDSIRAGAILLEKGTKGLDEFTSKMHESLGVAAKYEILMNTINGIWERSLAAVERLGAAIGAALGPAIDRAAKLFVGFVDRLTEIVKKNPELALQFARAAIAIGTTGAALLVAGPLISTFATAIIALSTPLGAVLAALVAGGAAWAIWTGDGQAAMAALGPTITSMRDTALAAFGAIGDALKKGDLAAAGAIFWKALEVEWLKGTIFLENAWVGFTNSLMDVWKSIGFNLQRVWIEATAGIRIVWANVLSFFEDGFIAAVARMGKAALDFFSPLAGIIKDILGIDVAKHLDAIVKPLEAARKARLSNKLGQIETERKDAQTKVDTDQANEQKSRRQALTPGQAQHRAELDKAQGELDGLVHPMPSVEEMLQPFSDDVGGSSLLQDFVEDSQDKDADDMLGKSRNDFDAPRTLKTRPWAKQMEFDPEAMQGVQDGLDRAAKQVDVKGSFNALSLAGLGSGDSVTSKIGEQVSEQKTTNRKLDRIKDKLEDGGRFA